MENGWSEEMILADIEALRYAVFTLCESINAQLGSAFFPAFIGNIRYYYGKRLLPDIITESNFVETAMSFLEKSYNNGYADTASRISHIVRYHHKKPIEALTILKEGTERGGFVSQHQLGDIYFIWEQDMGIEKNKDISIQRL